MSVWLGFEPAVVPAFVSPFLGEPSPSRPVWNECTEGIDSSRMLRGLRTGWLRVMRIRVGIQEEPRASAGHSL